MIKCTYCQKEFFNAGFKLTPAQKSISAWAKGNFCSIHCVVWWIFSDHKSIAIEILKQIEADAIVDRL